MRKENKKSLSPLLSFLTVIETDNKITVILACLRGGIAGIYIQRKLNELDKETRTQD